MVRFSLVTLLLAASALSGCSSKPAPTPERDSEIASPPGAARLLSLGSHLVDENQTSAELALNCAVALGVTEAAVAPLATAGNAKEIEMIGRAVEIYRNRAIDAAEGATERQITTDIARKTKSKASDKAGQGQLAIVCLRALEKR